MNTVVKSTGIRRAMATGLIRKSALVAAVAAMAAVAMAPGTAEARKIANPSPPDFYGQITGGYLQIYGSNASILGLSLDFAAVGSPNPSLRGTVDSSGNIRFPRAQVVFAPISVPLGSDTVNLSLLPTEDWVGKIDPLSGRVDLTAKFRVQATGVAQGISLGNNCFLGSASNPLTLNLTTHQGTFPTADVLRSININPQAGTTNGGAYSGEAYSDEPGLWPSGPAGDLLPLKSRNAGSVRSVDDTFGVPGASGCGPLNLADSQINSQLGLPAPAGGNRAVIDFEWVAGGTRVGSNAIVNKAVAPKITATGITAGATWPSTEIPELPTEVATTLDASSSVFYAGPNAGGKFRWDLGTGSYGAWTNGSTQVASFSTAGVKTIRLQARDVDGDISTYTRQINVVPSTDIALATSVAAGEFRGGSNGTYTYEVSNVSTERANTQPVVLTTTLPAGVSYVSASGTDWSCGSTAGTVTCTLPTGKLAASSSTSVSLTVAISPGAGASVSNSAAVAQAGDPHSGNNSASLETTVRRTDLKLTNTRNGNFTANGVWGYNLAVENLGDAPTVGNTTVTVTLPAGGTFVSAGSGGTGWSCARVGSTQDVSCSTSAVIAAGATAPALTVKQRIANTVSGTITSSGTVSTQGDVDAFGGGNTDTEDAEVAVVPDLAVYSNHSGSFVVGDQGTYTVRVDNESVLDAAGPTALAYDLPSGLKVSSASGTGWDCSATTAGSSRVECSYADTIAAGTSSSDVTVQVSVGHGSFPSTVHAPVIANSNDGYAANDTGSDSTTVKRLDLTISQTVAKAFSVGVEGLYRFSVTNVGDAATVGQITLLSNLPASVKLKSASGPGWDCTRSLAQKILCTRNASLAPDTVAGVIQARVDVLDQAGEDGQVENTAVVSTSRDDATVSGDSPVSGNNTSTISTKAVSVDLAATVSHPGDVLVGTKLTLGIKIRNVGTFPTVKGETVTVTDQLPDGIEPVIGEVWTDRSGWSCGAAGTLVTCTLTPASSTTSAMNVSDTATIELPVIATADAAESATNTVTVSTLKDSSVEKSPNNQGTDSLNVKRIDIDTTASQSIAPRAGGIGEVTVGVTNSGSNATIAPIEVTIPLPAGVSYRAIGSTTAGWACGSAGAGTSVVCSHTTPVASGGSAPQLKVRTFNSTAAPNTWQSDVVASTESEDTGLLEDNTATISATLQKVDLQLVKTHPGHLVKAGSRATFKLRVNNVGNRTSDGAIRVTDTLNPVFSRIQASGTGWTCAVAGQAVSCSTSAAVAAGGHAPDITVGADIPSDASGSYESDPIATVANDGDPFPSNNQSTDATSITTTQDLALASSPLGTFRIGGEATIRYRVTNVGSEIADGSPVARISDELPEGLVPVDYVSDDHWECDFADRKVDCDLTSQRQIAQADGLDGSDLDGIPAGLEPGQSSYLNVRVRVTGDAAGDEIGSIARVRSGSSGQDPNRSNDVAVGIYPIGSVDLAISDATASSTSFETGRPSRFTLNVTNHGSAPTLGTTRVTIPLSKGSTFSDSGVYGTGWDCRLVGEDIRCERQDVLAAGETAAPLQVAIVPSTTDLPTLESTFTVSADGDERTSDNTLTRNDPITDLTPEPDTSITNGPPPSTTATTAKVEFEASDPDSTFECILDGAAPTSCSSPLNLTGVAVGPHVLTITAIGSTGKREIEPAQFSWTVKKGGGTRTPLVATMKTGNINIPSLGELPLPADQLTLTGDIGEDGSWSVPASGIKFPVIAQDVDASGIKARIKVVISASAGGAGDITPGGGAATFSFPAKIKAEATLAGPSGGFDDGLVILGPSSQCFLQPINFVLTGTYDRNADTVTLSQTGVSIPKTSAGCGSLGATVDGALGLPRTDASISVGFQLGGGVKVGIVRPAATTRTMSIPVFCKGISSCGGIVQVLGTIRSGGKTRTVTLSKKAYSLKRGRAANVQMAFSDAIKKAVAQAGKNGMKVTVQVIANGTRRPVISSPVILRK